jgi:phosphatidylglycerol lysyltransferase
MPDGLCVRTAACVFCAHLSIIEPSMELLLVKYGYVLLFLGVAVEGEAFLLAASFLAHRGTLHLTLVILVAIAGNCAADQIYYVMARRRGRVWIEERFGQHVRYRQVVEWMSRHGNWLLLFSRFAFGFRIIIPAACGGFGMPVVRFTILNIIAGTIWAIPTALLGFYFGQAAALALVGIRRHQWWIIAGLLLIGAAVVLVRHVRHAEWVEDLKPVDLHTLAPFLIGLMGGINIVSAIWPRSHAMVQALTEWLPLEVSQNSRPLMLLAGIALLQVTRNLARRKELAWYVAVGALSVSLLVHITRALDFHHSAVAGLLLMYLYRYRGRFYARTDPSSLRLGLWMAPLLFAAVYLYGYVGLNHRHEQYTWIAGSTPAYEAFNSGLLIRTPVLEPKTLAAARFLQSLQVAGWLARIYLLVLFLRPVILRNRQEAPRDAVARIFRDHSRYSLSVFAVQPDKHHLVVAEGRAFVAYATRGAVALAAGDPLASDEDFERSVREYVQHCDRNGWTACIYEAAEERLPVYRSLGFRALKMAEEAVLELREFDLAGGKRANLRAMVNKTLKTGMIVRLYSRDAAPDPSVDEQLEAISQEWLAEKRIGELGFTLGRFSLEALRGVPVFIAARGERIEAFCSWLSYRNGVAVVLDLMRKRKDAVSGTMDLLISQSLLQLKMMGYTQASLANAPLANVSEPRGALDRGVALLFENLNAIYGYKNLFQFKKKFAPRWEGRYLVYPKGADLPRIAYALAGVHSSGGLRQLILRK